MQTLSCTDEIISGNSASSLNLVAPQGLTRPALLTLSESSFYRMLVMLEFFDEIGLTIGQWPTAEYRAIFQYLILLVSRLDRFMTPFLSTLNCYSLSTKSIYSVLIVLFLFLIFFEILILSFPCSLIR